MQGLGILFLTFGVWCMYCGGKGLRPIALLMKIVQDPSNAGSIIEAASAAAAESKPVWEDISEGVAAGGAAGGVAPSTGGSAPKDYALSKLASFGWDKSQFDPLDKLWMKESGWNPNAKNPSSGAYGIPQALPGSKMASAGADWQTNPNTQIDWGLGYIRARYGSPAKAWAHSQQTNWY